MERRGHFTQHKRDVDVCRLSRRCGRRKGRVDHAVGYCIDEFIYLFLISRVYFPAISVWVWSSIIWLGINQTPIRDDESEHDRDVTLCSRYRTCKDKLPLFTKPLHPLLILYLIKVVLDAVCISFRFKDLLSQWTVVWHRRPFKF